MKTIWKFPLIIGQKQVIEMPIEADILTVQSQFNEPMMWAIVNPENEKQRREFALFGTGHPMPDLVYDKLYKYINTFQVDRGNYVFHLFEVVVIDF